MSEIIQLVFSIIALMATCGLIGFLSGFGFYIEEIGKQTKRNLENCKRGISC